MRPRCTPYRPAAIESTSKRSFVLLPSCTSPAALHCSRSQPVSTTTPSRKSAPSHACFALSKTHPPMALAVRDESHAPVPLSTATQAPPSKTFGAVQLMQPASPAAKQLPHLGLQSRHVEVVESQYCFVGQVTKVALDETAWVAATHFVGFVEWGWSPSWHVWHWPAGPEHDAHDGSQTVSQDQPGHTESRSLRYSLRQSPEDEE